MVEEEAREYDAEPSRRVKKHVVRTRKLAATNEKVSLSQGRAKPAADKSSRKSIGSSRIDASASTKDDVQPARKRVKCAQPKKAPAAQSDTGTGRAEVEGTRLATIISESSSDEKLWGKYKSK